MQYEGEESSKNVFYTGAAPNQQAIPAVDYLMNDIGVKRWVLAGTDYVYPRTTNKILEAYLKAKGVAADDIMINYTPFGHSDWQSIVSDIKKFGSAGKKTAVVSTINGDANVPFYKELGNQGISAEDIPVVAFSVGEEELSGIDTKPLVGHLAAWNYFMSVEDEANDAFIETWQNFIKNDERVTNDPMEAHYIGFNMWVEAVKKAGTTDPEAVGEAIIGVAVPNLTGGYSAMMPNHHITKPVLIGEIQDDGQFQIVWQTSGPGGRRCLVRLPGGLQGHHRRLARTARLRQLQRQDGQVLGTELLTAGQQLRPLGAPAPAGPPPLPRREPIPNVVDYWQPCCCWACRAPLAAANIETGDPALDAAFAQLLDRDFDTKAEGVTPWPPPAIPRPPS